MLLSEEVRFIRKLSRCFVRELGVLDTRLKPKAVPLSFCHALIELEERGLLTQNELADILRIDKSAMSRVVSQLLKKGWVEIAIDPGDLRKKVVRLSNSGKSKVKELQGSADSQVQVALASLTPKERKLVKEGLSIYVSALQQRVINRSLAPRAK